MTQQQPSQRSRVSSPLSPPGSHRRKSVRTRACQMARRTDRSPPAPLPWTPGRDATAGCRFKEEEEEKRVDNSPMRALFRSLCLEPGGGRTRSERMETPQAQVREVLVEGVLTELVHARAWRSTPSYFVVEASVDRSGHVRFCVRQFQYVAESTKRGRLMARIALSPRDVVTDRRHTHSQATHKYVLELHLAAYKAQRIERNAKARRGNGRADVIRLAAENERAHIKWVQILESCTKKLIAQRDEQARVARGTEPAKILPLPGQDESRSRDHLAMHREERGCDVSDTSSECSNQEHSDDDYPAEEIRAAKQHRPQEEENQAEVKHARRPTDRGALSSAMEERRVPTVGDDSSCTHEYQTTPGVQDARTTAHGNACMNHEDNQRDHDSVKDWRTGDGGMKSAVPAYKSAVSGRWMSPSAESREEDAHTRIESPERQSARETFGATSTSSKLDAVPRQQTHTFLSNGQVFTLDTRYELIKPIGNGAYGAVVAVKDALKNGDHVAVKKIANIFEDLVDAKRILREIRLLGHFRHKNITHLLDLSPPQSRQQFHDMYIITELMETDLHQQQDIAFVTNANARRFLTALAIAKPTPWRDVFAGTEAEHVSLEALDLLTNMLVFNPAKRISVDAALQHPYLAPFWDEHDLVVARPFDSSFDVPDHELSQEGLIDLFCEDIERFHPCVPTCIVPMPVSSVATRLFRRRMMASAS
ncbi:hypothetical protein PsorP6_016118 [Peronosclerospora sorghi]|uniref:Uncharacterized protein n=1 Tax=Peronosclerospora sorghi TaxID=230839 RepID=A0ACC0VLA2_9STRA|nr:hypothetical protein PsorP6_016118 [Peronosclerospora sorghi]